MSKKVSNNNTQKETVKVSSKEKWEKGRLGEVTRFILCGLAIVILDFAISYILRRAFTSNWNSLDNISLEIAATTICVSVSFLLVSILNYFISKNWVFKNVDKDINYGSFKYVSLYFALAFGGLILSTGLMILGEYIIYAYHGNHLHYPIDPFSKDMWTNMSTHLGIPFWSYLGVFGIKSVLILIYNYFTRKCLIFKQPKEVKVVEESAPEIKEEVIETKVTKAKTIEQPVVQFEESVSEPKPEVKKVVEEPKTSVNTVYCKPQFNWGKPATKEFIKKEIFTSLQVYDKRKAREINTGRAKNMIVKEINAADKNLKDKYNK